MAETPTLMTLLLFSMGQFLLANSKDANITCVISDDCVLPCGFRPTGTVVIHWYKQQIPVHSYYYNKDQFGLQNKHFSGRTSLFNSQIPHGNASLLLRRLKVQDKGRYKCYTSTRKGNQEIFVNLDVRAPIQSMIMELTEETFSCSTHNTYPVPQVTWSTDPPSAEGALNSSTITIVDSKGLFAVESTLRILGNLYNYTYFCSFVSADKTQVWTASWKKQDYIKQEEGRALSIPCIAPFTLQNFSLTWTFMSSSEPVVILKYDTKNRRIFNVWEDHAELDPEQLLLSNATLLLHKPSVREHSGTFTCVMSGLQSKHTIQTDVNVTASSAGEGELRGRRSWWCTAASAGFFAFIIVVMIPRCARRKGAATAAAHRFNGVVSVDGGIHKDLHVATNGANQRGAGRLQPRSEVQGRGTDEEGAPGLPSSAEENPEVEPEDELEEEKDGLVENGHCGNSEPLS